ncbi:MAG TPA: permease-like cell division protein FtsX [Actinomycetota bacterium]|nr:permease-like cell division protein FtsX [Actinomycetota bacterium]
MARRFEYYFRETVSGLKRNGLVAFAAVATVFISLFLLGSALLIGKQVNLVVDASTENVEVAVFLQDDISPSDKARIEQRLDGMPEVASVRYESKEEALQRFKHDFQNQKNLWEGVSADALPASFRVKLADPEKFEVVAAQLEGQPGVEKIRDERETLNKLFAISNVLQWGAIIAFVVMLVAAVGLIANTVRMAVFARRKEIGIMRLVGATSWFIRVPFLVEGLVAGVIGSVLAIVTLLVLQKVFFASIHHNVRFLPLLGPDAVYTLVPLLVAVGVIVAIFASWIAMRRFLEV